MRGRVPNGSPFRVPTMAACIYCGKRVGFFSNYHEACSSEAKKNRDLSLKIVTALIEVAAKERQPISEVQDQFSKIISHYKVSSELIGQTLLSTVDELSKEAPLPTTSAEYLQELCENILSDPEDIPSDSALKRSYMPTILNLGLSRNLWLVMQGERVELRTPCDVVLQPGENRLAEFGSVIYRKSVMVSSHTGSYNGVGVRVASGLYYRFGAYAGQTVSSPELQNVDFGFWVLSNKSMYFGGRQTTFQIPYNSILRFKAYPDGLGPFRNTGAGIEEVFTVLNPGLSTAAHQPVPLEVGWFLYNLTAFLTMPE